MEWTLDLNHIKIKRSITVKINIEMEHEQLHARKNTKVVMQEILDENKYKNGNKMKIIYEYQSIYSDLERDYKLISNALEKCLEKLHELGYDAKINYGHISEFGDSRKEFMDAITRGEQLDND